MSLIGQGQRGNVLKMRRVQRAENPRRVHDCADIGAVGAASAHAGVAQLVHQVRAGAAGQLVHARLRVGVVQHHRVGALQQAGGLLVAGLVKALLIQPDAQAARGPLGALFQQT